MSLVVVVKKRWLWIIYLIIVSFIHSFYISSFVVNCNKINEKRKNTKLFRGYDDRGFVLCAAWKGRVVAVWHVIGINPIWKQKLRWWVWDSHEHVKWPPLVKLLLNLWFATNVLQIICKYLRTSFYRTYKLTATAANERSCNKQNGEQCLSKIWVILYSNSYILPTLYNDITILR